jgi:hypothetical protein
MFTSIKLSRIGLTCCLALILLALAPAAHALGPKGDLYLGYSRLGANAFYPNVGGLNGLEAAGHLKLRPFLGAEVDVSHYGYGASADVPHTTTVLVGPRLTVGAAGFKVFAHALVGGEHSSNSGGGVSVDGGAFAYALGGGLDVPIVPFFAWRVNGDYIAAPTQNTQNATQARFSTGLVFRF